MVFAEPLVRAFAGGFEDVPGKLELTVLLTRIMLPFLTFVALAAAFLPRIVLVAGGVCAAAGYFIIAGAHDPDWLLWGLRFAGAGSGALKACLDGMALLVLPSPRLRFVYIALTYGLLNLAAVVAVPLGGFLASAISPETVFIVAGVVVVIGLVPAVAFIVVDKLRSALTNLRFQPQRQRLQKLQAIELRRGLNDPLIARLWLTHADVLFDRAGEEKIILQHDAHLSP